MKKPLAIYTVILIVMMLLICQNFICKDGIVRIENKPTQIQPYEGWLKAASEDRTVMLHNVIPDNIQEGDAISFFTIHQCISVSIEGREIYYFGNIKTSPRNTPGCVWNFVPLKLSDAGKLITITMTTKYKNCMGNIPEITWGNMSDLKQDAVMDGLGSLSICIAIFVIGLIICIAWVLVRKQLKLGQNFLCMGLLAIMLSLWSGVETQVLSIYFAHNYAFGQLAFVSLILMQFPFLHFVKVNYEIHNNKLLNFAYLQGFAATIVVIICDLLRIADFRETIILIHISSGITLLITLWILYGIKRHGESKFKHLATIHLFCTIAVGITVVLDAVVFYIRPQKDSATFLRIGMLLYVVVLTSISLKNSIELVRAGHEAEKIKVVAFHDALTGLGNRASFLKEIETIDCDDYVRYGIAMFDLNNLKHFNDVYGHNVGDYYIILCSEMLQDILYGYGTCYRIGGDEFCAILKDVSMEQYMAMGKELSMRMKSLKGPYTDGSMEIAQGYTCFNKEKDADLFATQNRADRSMYANKMELKGKP